MKGNLKFIILKTLEKLELSGYGLMNHIKEDLGKKPSPGSVYPLLEQLHKDKLIKKKSAGRKDLYSLTAKGKQETKKFDKLKGDLFKNMEKNIRMWGLLYNQDVTQHLEAIQAMQSDKKQPFKEICKDLDAMKLQLFKIYKQNKLKKNASKINAILRETTKKLKQIK